MNQTAAKSAFIGVYSPTVTAFKEYDENDSKNFAPMSGVGDIYGIGQGLTAVMNNLPSLGIGSKSRITETNNTAAANVALINAQKDATMQTEKQKSDSKTKTYLLIGVGVLLFLVVGGVLFLRR